MAPLNWVGGLIKVQRNSDDSKNGPICKIKAGADEFEVHIEGYAEVLGINGEIKILVSDTEFEFRVSGTMWPGIFDASIELKASYGSIDTLSFSVSIYRYLIYLIIINICYCFKCGLMTIKKPSGVSSCCFSSKETLKLN
ncbi:uncharacterized protein LOC130623549 [Hydractinia symbiolongicarpus]|uniref:uncharacterized protein LOC130623549 n=1 Tax=Hydractinia symbiolongicarpus TaxID=13093 RepID=UPI00254BF9CA|nr:uncharacterized protein LOC130623549 [Hydractinia symbiolongicarpus]